MLIIDNVQSLLRKRVKQSSSATFLGVLFTFSIILLPFLPYNTFHSECFVHSHMTNCKNPEAIYEFYYSEKCSINTFTVNIFISHGCVDIWSQFLLF